MSGVVVITGASRGIGRATALLMAGHGFTVCVGYASNEHAASEVVRKIEQDGGKAFAVKCDVGNESDIVEMFKSADAHGALAGLVNNAGIVETAGRVEDMPRARIDRVLSVNVTGAFLCAREAIRRMAKKHGGKGGAIVNLSSMVATLGGANLFVDYAAAKGAIDSFTVGLARELAGEGIRVNAVRPGVIATDIHASGGDPDRAAKVVGSIPMQRVGEPEEVAQTIAWLMSDKASYVTGALVDVSGGR